MKIDRAMSLGLLRQQLGINPDARISFKLVPGGVLVWDLETEIEHTANMGNLSSSRRALPPEIRRVINASDEDLRREFSSSFMDGWTEERETMFTELAFRGINALGL